jgi:crossover junction endodeoxyribonuclease RusA
MGQSCRVLLSKKGRQYKQDVCNYIADLILDSHDFKIPLLGRLSVHIVLHAPNRRKYDIDGRLKSLLDALEDAGVYPNDEAIDHLVVRRGDIIKGGKVFVQIMELPSKEQT